MTAINRYGERQNHVLFSGRQNAALSAVIFTVNAFWNCHDGCSSPVKLLKRFLKLMNPNPERLVVKNISIRR